MVKFYSHVNYSVTKIVMSISISLISFYSHVNYSVTKMWTSTFAEEVEFYSHVNYSVTKIPFPEIQGGYSFTVT